MPHCHKNCLPMVVVSNHWDPSCEEKEEEAAVAPPPHLMCPFADDDDDDDDCCNDDTQKEKKGSRGRVATRERRLEVATPPTLGAFVVGEAPQQCSLDQKDARVSQWEGSSRRRRRRRQGRLERNKDETASVDRFPQRRRHSRTSTDDSSSVTGHSCASDVASCSTTASSASWGTRVWNRLRRRKPRVSKETEDHEASDEEEEEEEQHPTPLMTMVDILDSDGPCLQQSVISLLSSHSPQADDATRRRSDSLESTGGPAILRRRRDGTRHVRSESYESCLSGKVGPRCVDTVWSLDVTPPSPPQSGFRHRRAVSFPPELATLQEPATTTTTAMTIKTRRHRRVVSFPPELGEPRRAGANYGMELPPVYPKPSRKEQRGRLYLSPTMAEF